MLGPNKHIEFPALERYYYRETSDPSNLYNCIAWAANDDTKWWWPDRFNIGYWPSSVPREITLHAFIELYKSFGYESCDNGDLEPGVEKVALFAGRDRGGEIVPTHAAKQLSNGHWTSKMGPYEDIEHSSLDAICGPTYGSVVKYLKRNGNNTATAR